MRPRTIPPGPASSSLRALFWRLIAIYILASIVAVALTLLLGLFGLEFTMRQWLIFWTSVPIGVAFYTAIDVIVIRTHLAPLAPALAALDRGERPEPSVAGAALVRTLNLPLFSALRVILLENCCWEF